MSMIEQVHFYHNVFVTTCNEDRSKISNEYKKSLLVHTSISLPFDKYGGRRASDTFHGYDNLFQLAFWTNEL